MDCSRLGSIASLVFLFQTTRRPEGQSPASSIAIFLASRRPDCGMRSQIPPALWQNRAEAHKCSASVNFNAGPSIFLACLRQGSRLAVSVPSKLVFVCVPSQKGLFLDCPHRQRAHFSCEGYLLPTRHSLAVPSSSAMIICSTRGISPVTR